MDQDQFNRLLFELERISKKLEKNNEILKSINNKLSIGTENEISVSDQLEEVVINIQNLNRV